MPIEFTIRVSTGSEHPDELAQRLQHFRERLPEIVERSLRELANELSAEELPVYELSVDKISMSIEDITPQDEIALLEAYADLGDYRAFGELAERIDWAVHSPDDLTAALDMALGMEMSRLAMKLAQIGGRLFPDNERVQQAAQVLAPPVTQVTRLPSGRGLEQSRLWFRQHASEYKGQWVAVREGRLLGAAHAFDAIASLIGEGEDAASTIVTRIL
ncbi:MAG TPA: hypothetical protein ENN19_04180 [Chloroflexi bacterium]|nr:hypothetical protein [Chloroflexota bacterium]